MKSHLLEKKSPKRKRSFGKDDALAPGDEDVAKRLLGRG
jgi:ribosomal protein L35